MVAKTFIIWQFTDHVYNKPAELTVVGDKVLAIDDTGIPPIVLVRLISGWSCPIGICLLLGPTMACDIVFIPGRYVLFLLGTFVNSCLIIPKQTPWCSRHHGSVVGHFKCLVWRLSGIKMILRFCPPGTVSLPDELTFCCFDMASSRFRKFSACIKTAEPCLHYQSSSGIWVKL